MGARIFPVDNFLGRAITGVIDLDSDTIKAALVQSTVPKNANYYIWFGSATVQAGQIWVPTTDNGHRYIAIIGGVTAQSEPTWPKTALETVTDGTVTWQEFGGLLADKSIWGDVSAYEVGEGDGYTSGGLPVTLSLTNEVMTVEGKARTVAKIDASDLEWEDLTKTFRYLWIYKSGTVGAIVNPLVGYVLLDTTPADVVVSGSTFRVVWHVDGVYHFVT